MDPNVLINGLLYYLGLVVLLTFHEFGHAWMAWKCGDDTAKSLGRCSLNPIVHIDPIGTVLLPMMQIFFPAVGQYLIGWAKPVPVNVANLRNPRVDDILVAMAGPWMNLALAVVLVGLAKLAVVFGAHSLAITCLQTAHISLLLCFFNLIPIPPLDGSHVMRNLTGMSYETYAQLAQFGFIAVILVLQIPWVGRTLSFVTITSLRIISSWFGLH